MYPILLVLNDPDRLEDLLLAWEEKGVRGATVMSSTVFTAVDNETNAEAILAATKNVIGNLEDQGTGLLLDLPVLKAFRMNKKET